jgi:membrane associated rhomboid family serine protease
MGIYDRGYYKDDEWKGPAGSRHGGTLSIVVILIIINSAVLLLDMFTGQATLAGQPVDSQKLASFLSLKHGLGEPGAPGPLDNPLYVYQLLTYGFAHSSITSDRGIFHLLFNMLVLFLLGRQVEERYGRAEFLRIWLVALVVGGLTWLAISVMSGRQAQVLGASGAVTAVVMLFIFNFPQATIHFMGFLPMKAWVVGIILVAGDLLSAAGAEGNVAYDVHLSGAAFAAAYHYGKWNFGWLKFDWLTNRLARRPRLKVHDPGRSATDSLSGEADRILDKINREGESSLTRRERRILERYSREVRERRGK